MSLIPPDDSLQQAMQARIAEVAAIADDLPGITIIHDLRNWSVAWMCKRGLQQIGATLEEVTRMSAEEYHSKYFNDEDAKDYVPKILGMLEKDTEEEICTFFQQVRLSGSPDWVWYLSSTKIFMRDENRKPLLTYTIAIPIDSMHHLGAKAERLLAENNFLRSHYNEFARLSDRECDILRQMALGKSSTETAQTLFISKATVETHRRNIKKKLKTSSFFELCQYARSFDLI